ncbi:MAG: hypothetical protein H7Y22_06270 [Gemmatimonadaceae bacterium]|nr:hypothetical protein [Gloeobacterales cyanobacterium ES-bin-141]
MSQSDVGRVLSNYASGEFTAKASRPHCQFNNRSKANHGLLIDRPNIEASRFRHTIAATHGWRKITQEFSGSDQPVACLLCPDPILIVLRRGVTRVYDRTTGDSLGIYEARSHSQLDAKKVTRFLVYLTVRGGEGDYTLLHPEPLQLSMKGVQRGAFLEPGGHLDTLDRAIAQHYNGAPPFAFAVPLHTSAEVRGNGGNSSLVTVLAKPEPISNRDTLDALFVGEENLQLLTDAYELSRPWQQSDRGGEATDAGES